MDAQQVFDALLNQAAAKRFAESDQLSLGELIARLEAQPAGNPIKVEWNGGLADVEGLNSYRGYYSDLAIETAIEGVLRDVAAVVRLLTDANGRTFQGYKGGDYTMHRSTPVWVANYGETSGIGVVGVEEIEGVTVVRTRYVETDW